MKNEYVNNKDNRDKPFSIEKSICSDIDSLYSSIDKNGYLNIIDQYWSALVGDKDKFVFDNKSYECVMSCTKEDIDEFKKRVIYLLTSLQNIAEYENKNEKLPEQLQKIADKYLKDYDVEGFDLEKIASIELKNYTLYKLRRIAENNPFQLTEDDEDIYYDDKVTVSEEESEYVKKYLDHIHQQVVERIGDGFDGEKIIYTCKRICKLMALKSNEIIIAFEASQLAETMLMNEFAISREEI